MEYVKIPGTLDAEAKSDRRDRANGRDRSGRSGIHGAAGPHGRAVGSAPSDGVGHTHVDRCLQRAIGHARRGEPGLWAGAGRVTASVRGAPLPTDRHGCRTIGAWSFGCSVSALRGTAR